MNRFRMIFLSSLILLLFLTGFIEEERGEPYLFSKMKFFPEMPENPDNPVTMEGVQLGRYLFYDPILSADSSISCASCHQQEYAFSDAPTIFSKGAGERKMIRNTPPLFNLAWYPELFWDGRAKSLEDQVFFSVRAPDEMNLSWTEVEKRINRNRFYRDKFAKIFGNQTIDSVMISKVIAQFERTLLSHNSKYDKVIRGEAYFTDKEYAGFNLMNDQTKGDCLHCHTTDGNALGTTLGFSNNGLDAIYEPTGYLDPGRGGVTGNLEEQGRFKIPSLRNVVLTPPYMHDGRFSTLKEVLEYYSTGVHYSANVDSKMEFAYRGGANLSETDKQNILEMLRTLTDSVFISDPRFGNPFAE